LQNEHTDRRVGGARIISDQSGHTSQLWPLVNRFVHHASTIPEGVASTESLASFQRELLGELKRLYGQPMPAAQLTRGRPVTVNEAAIARAVDQIESCPTPGIPIAELVQTTGLSERSLRAGFQKYLGVSPTRYMQLRMLNIARQRLTASAPGETTVTQVAGALGIWDVGRFARRYREIFGELPSTTLGKSGRQGK
jgi:AraC family ethanolamine operon transcriptional activator